MTDRDPQAQDAPLGMSERIRQAARRRADRQLPTARRLGLRPPPVPVPYRDDDGRESVADPSGAEGGG
jgi:hypothetical protein